MVTRASAVLGLSLFAGCALTFRDYGDEPPGSGGQGGEAGAVAHGDRALGEPCQTDECLPGLICWRHSPALPGPAGGMCTRSCDEGCPSSSVCHAFGEAADYCLPSCVYGALDDKCHGRPDVACLSGALSGLRGDRCVPLCRDGDCDAGSVCDPRTKLCAQNETGGERVYGETCDPLDDDCRGDCGGPLRTCRERCRIGDEAACGDRGACLGEDNLSAPGDAGVCRRHCSCDRACSGGLACDESGAAPHCSDPAEVNDACDATLGTPAVSRFLINQGDSFIVRDFGPPPQQVMTVTQSFGGTPYLEPKQGRTALVNPFDFGGRAGGQLGAKLAAAVLATEGRVLTIEAVARTLTIEPFTEGALFDVTSTFTTLPTLRMAIGAGDDAAQYLALYLNTVPVRHWSLAGIDTEERHVYHLVLDTLAMDPLDRARLYVDAALVTPEASLDLPLGSGIALSADDEVSLMNDWGQLVSFVGALHYLAVYLTPLSPSVMAQHAAALLYDDDAPSTPVGP